MIGIFPDAWEPCRIAPHCTPSLQEDVSADEAAMATARGTPTPPSTFVESGSGESGQHLDAAHTDGDGRLTVVTGQLVGEHVDVLDARFRAEQLASLCGKCLADAA